MEQKINFATITACGECCEGCAKKLDGRCPGCIAADGHVPEWAESGRCRVHECVHHHHVSFCGLCEKFPCKDVTTIIHWNPDAVAHLTQLAEQYRAQEK